MEPGELLRICDTVPENGTGKDCPNPAQEARSGEATPSEARRAIFYPHWIPEHAPKAQKGNGGRNTPKTPQNGTFSE